MSKFNNKKDSKGDTTNLAGGDAFSREPEWELTVSALSTFLEDKFYETAEERVTRMQALIDKVDDKFVAKLAIYARRECNLRSVSHFLIGELAERHKGDSLVSETIYNATVRTDDMAEIVAYVGEPIPNQVKKGVAKAIREFDRYQLSKYRLENKEISLVDLFNISHPDPSKVSDEKAQAWEDLINDELTQERTWESQKSNEDKDDAEVWRERIVEEADISYFALLRNLRNIAEEADKETQEKAREILTDRERVEKSRVLPFRFFTAYRHVSDQDMLEAISEAMELSVSNVREFDGETLIALDSSGSMGSSYDSPLAKGSIFAACLFKNSGADFVTYDTELEEVKALRDEPVLSIVDKVLNMTMGGGTQTSLAFDYAKKQQKDYDRVIIISDQESWAEHSYAHRSNYHNVQEAYNSYKGEVKADPNVFAIDIQGYGTKDIEGDKIFHVAGWSSKLLDYIEWMDSGKDLLDDIKQINI